MWQDVGARRPLEDRCSTGQLIDQRTFARRKGLSPWSDGLGRPCSVPQFAPRIEFEPNSVRVGDEDRIHEAISLWWVVFVDRCLHPPRPMVFRLAFTGW